jgi:hypothetical protein
MFNTNEFIQYIHKNLVIFDIPFLKYNCKKWIFSNFNNYYVKSYISNCTEEDLNYMNKYFNAYLIKNKKKYNFYHYKIIKSLIKYIFVYIASNCSDKLIYWFVNKNYLPEKKEKDYIFKNIPTAISLDFVN